MNDELMRKHLKLVLEANKVTNLTRINDEEEATILHIEDSLAGLQELQAAPEGRYADIGTGGGFPGIPLAIASGRNTLLVDSVKKKMAILDDVIDELGLSGTVSTYAGRIEELAKESPAEFSVVTARALSRISVLMELANPLLFLGGMLICYKANIESEELAHALSLQEKLGMKLLSDRSFVLSDGKTQRRIVVFEKIGKAEISLPRRVGMAQKKPL